VSAWLVGWFIILGTMFVIHNRSKNKKK